MELTRGFRPREAVSFDVSIGVSPDGCHAEALKKWLMMYDRPPSGSRMSQWVKTSRRGKK
jgi:hypothetical protein